MDVLVHVMEACILLTVNHDGRRHPTTILPREYMGIERRSTTALLPQDLISWKRDAATCIATVLSGMAFKMLSDASATKQCLQSLAQLPDLQAHLESFSRLTSSNQRHKKISPTQKKQNK